MCVLKVVGPIIVHLSYDVIVSLYDILKEECKQISKISRILKKALSMFLILYRHLLLDIIPL